MDSTINQSTRLKRKVIGLNTYLSAVLGEDLRLSLILTRLGLTSSEILRIKRECLTVVVEKYIEAIKERVHHQADGHRLFLILSRRFGLDGCKQETLQSLADELSLSRERVRQLEQKALRKSKNKNHRSFLVEKFKEIVNAEISTPETE